MSKKGMKIEQTFTIMDAECIQEDEDQILVDAPDFDEPEWIPMKQISDDSEVLSFGDEGDLVVSESLAEKRGWI